MGDLALATAAILPSAGMLSDADPFFGIRKSIEIRQVRLLRSRLRAIWTLTRRCTS
jgi:hypothetical protein